MANAIEALCSWFPYLVPLVALLGLWIARCSSNKQLRALTERCFFALLLVVGGGTLRTMVADDHCWLLHTASFAVMVVGAIVPGSPSSTFESL